ncbi:MAG: response regulator [Crocinitomicaceae bacterium]|jgi:signal transduction histidine kinase|tara:strand:+ start:43036 stop:44385 length:1350 start_codon:yes stop_codon:yes gene_type:complete
MLSAQILIVEDDFAFAEMVKFQLTTTEIQSENIISVDSISEAKETRSYLEPDVILLDLNIKDSNGVETYEKIFDLFPLASVIVLSGMDDEAIALEIVSKGGQDYVLKSNLNAQVLNRTIKYGLLRRELSNEVRKSERKFKDVFNKSPLPIVQLIGAELRTGLINDAAQRLYECTHQELSNRSFSSFNANKDIKIDSKGGRYTQITGKGNEVIVDIVINEISSDTSESEYIALIIDKTKELEFEKQKFNIISQAEESEKKKIARELHDGLGQQMVLLNLLFQNLSPADDQKEKFDDLGNLLQSCIREVKDIAYNLLPPELEKGFLNAIDRFANRIRSIGDIQFIVDIEEGLQESDLNQTDKFNLYRIIQELFNNSLKHAKATEFSIEIRKYEKGIRLKASDNGIGFDIKDVQKGLGIENIQYRINMAGIDGEFESSKDNGTSVIMRIQNE